MKTHIENKVIDDVTVKTFVVTHFYLIDGFTDTIMRNDLEEMIIREKGRIDFLTIECLYFQDCQFAEFPLFLKDHFQHVKYLHAANCGIKSVSHEAFAPFSNLVGLFLEGNNIIEFPYRQLVFFSKLRICSFGKDCNVSENVKIFLGQWSSQETVFESVMNGSFKAILRDDEVGTTSPEIDPEEISPEILTEVSLNFVKKTEMQKAARLEREEITPRRPHKIEEAPEVRLSVSPYLYNAAHALEHLKDFTIRVDDTIIKAHRVVLASYSGMMLDLFQKYPPAKTMTLIEVEADAVQTCIDFMYGKLPIPKMMTTEKLYHLMAAAEKLGIDGMCDFVENSMKLLMNPKVVVEILGRFKSERLKNTAFDYVKQLFPEKKLCPSIKNNAAVVNEMLQCREKLAELERTQLETKIMIKDLTKELENVIENCCEGKPPGHYREELARPKYTAEHYRGLYSDSQLVQAKLAADRAQQKLEQEASTSKQTHDVKEKPQNDQDFLGMGSLDENIDLSCTYTDTETYSDTVSEISGAGPIYSDISFEIPDIQVPEVSEPTEKPGEIIYHSQMNRIPVEPKYRFPSQSSDNSDIEIIHMPTKEEAFVLVSSDEGREEVD